MGCKDDHLDNVAVFNGLTGEFLGTFGSIEKVSLKENKPSFTEEVPGFKNAVKKSLDGFAEWYSENVDKLRKENSESMSQLMKFDYKKLEKLVKYYNELNGRKPYIICNYKTAEMFMDDIMEGDDAPWSISLNDLVVFGSRVLVDHGLKDYEVEVR